MKYKFYVFIKGKPESVILEIESNAGLGKTIRAVAKDGVLEEDSDEDEVVYYPPHMIKKIGLISIED